MATNKRSDRSTNWGFVMYPESMPEDWREILVQTHVAIAISPLHDKDENPGGESETKKPHYHVVVTFDTLKTYEQAYEVSSSVNGTAPQRIKSLKGNVRYFTHMDNPEKHQYSRDDIQSLNGFDVDIQFTPTATDRILFVEEMIEFVEKNNVTELIDMMRYASSNRREDWFPLLAESCGYIIGQVIKSQRHKRRVGRVDIETGEIIE